MKKTSVKRSMSQHDLTALSKNRVRKTFGTCVSNHEVGPKRTQAHNTSNIQLPVKMDADVNHCREDPHGEQDSRHSFKKIDRSIKII